MRALTRVKIPGEADTLRESQVLTNQRTKVLSNTECPSCRRKGSLEVFLQKHGELTFCYSCGHREISFCH